MAFHEMTGSVDFLGVHPQYREKGIAKAFCEKALHELVCAVRASQDFTLLIGAGALLGVAITVLGTALIDRII